MHLKNRFGAGYHIELVSAAGKEEALKGAIKKLLPGSHDFCAFFSSSFLILDSRLNVEVSGNLSYSLPTSRLDMLQKFFIFLESQEEQKSSKKKHGKGGKEKLVAAKDSSLIQDWGISQTSASLPQ